MTITYHGDPVLNELQRFGLDLKDVLDFSICVNPYGPSPKVPAALADVSLSNYPDRQTIRLRRALADWLGTDADRILPGNGSSELIWLLCLAILKPQDRVLVPEPTYGEYVRSAAMMQARIVPLRTGEADYFMLDPVRIRSELRSRQPRIAFLCNPNNPTGTVLRAEQIAGWAEEFHDCLFVVDESYLHFAEGIESVLEHPRDNIVVLRSMTKDFALAGLRLGFVVAVEKLIESLSAVQPPWSVNAMAQAAGVAALEDLAHMRSSIESLRRDKFSLVKDLRALGMFPLDSATHFFLVHVGSACEFRKKLLKHGILVRDCTSFGLPGFVRIATRRPEDNVRLVQIIKEVLI